MEEVMGGNAKNLLKITESFPCSLMAGAPLLRFFVVNRVLAHGRHIICPFPPA